MSWTMMCLVKINKANTATSVRRSLSYRGIQESLERYLEPKNAPPYSHICQVGDPVLRAQTQPVEPEVIPTPAFQRIIKHMTYVMRSYKAMGLSATQIGLGYQIFIIEVTEEHLKGFDAQEKKIKQVQLVPLQVFVNPKMKILDYATVKYTEECLSILGYSAVVPRAKTIQIEALNAFGKPFVWDADGWTARIAQHEMDHLQGKLYVDRMDANTFSCKFWKLINSTKGTTRMQYYPKSWLRRYF